MQKQGAAAHEHYTLSEEAFQAKKSRGKKRGHKKGGQKGQQQSLATFFEPVSQHRKVTSFKPDEEMKDEEERKEPLFKNQQQPQSCWEGYDLQNTLI